MFERRSVRGPAFVHRSGRWLVVVGEIKANRGKGRQGSTDEGV